MAGHEPERRLASTRFRIDAGYASAATSTGVCEAYPSVQPVAKLPVRGITLRVLARAGPWAVAGHPAPDRASDMSIIGPP